MAFGMFEFAVAAFLFIVGALIVLFIAFTMLKDILKFVVTLFANSVVGLLMMLLLYLIGVKVPLTIPVLITIALFGLGGLGTVLILMFAGALKP